MRRVSSSQSQIGVGDVRGRVARVQDSCKSSGPIPDGRRPTVKNFRQDALRLPEAAALVPGKAAKCTNLSNEKPTSLRDRPLILLTRNESAGGVHPGAKRWGWWRFVDRQLSSQCFYCSVFPQTWSERFGQAFQTEVALFATSQRWQLLPLSISQRS